MDNLFPQPSSTNQINNNLLQIIGVQSLLIANLVDRTTETAPAVKEKKIRKAKLVQVNPNLSKVKRMALQKQNDEKKEVFSYCSNVLARDYFHLEQLVF